MRDVLGNAGPLLGPEFRDDSGEESVLRVGPGSFGEHELLDGS